jgi:class 3 adenylate cyclase/DNA-binding winged helix-turn-helix (wHTH) protein/tetratricopeptide (TPR) repeat protein
MRYLFGDYVLDTERHELHGAGMPIKLRRKVFQVLAYLLAHCDRVVSKHELLEQLWPEQFVGDEALKACIKTLRQALGEQGRTAHFIHTRHGQGYRFIAAVEVQEHLPADAALPVLALPPSLPPLPAGEQVLCEIPSPLARALEGEHKQVTVLCGALAEASTLAARLGPEAMYHLMHDVLALAQDTVQRYGGTLLQVSGEGFVALFGAPVAYEDHARRAVLAALELRQHLRVPNAIRGQPHGVAVGLGLHTGPVVVGFLGHDPQRPYTAAGVTLDLATRLQQRAAPDTILCSAAAYGLVQAEVQGDVWAAGPSNAASPPVVGYVVHSLLRRRAGVPWRGTRPLSRFVGRTQELTLLHERLAQAASGQGQVIGIAGESGMGKSRLLAEFAHSLAGQAVTYCEGHCLAYGSITPYLPVRDLLRQLWSLPDPAAPDALTATIEQRLQAAGIVSEEAPLLLRQLLDVLGDAASLAALSPEVRRVRTFALLRQLFLHASQRQPLVLAVENLHWTDPTSEEWLTTLAAQVGGTAILLVATYRPGYRLPWLTHSWATQVALPPLTPRDSLAVVQTVPQAAQLSARQQQAIVAKAAGNPFFLEELPWAVVANGDQTYTLPLPETIEAVLAARLDRLPLEAKRLVQTAAVIGPEVPVPLLQAIANLPEAPLHGALAQLQAAEFLYETRLFPDHVYTFKHVLTHEVAYSSLLQERRRVLHVRIVEALETIAGERVAEQVDQLAHHAFLGAVWDKAVTYCRQAGAKAAERSALREAAAAFERALVALQQLPDSRTTHEQAIDLRFDLRHALLPLGEFGRLLDHLRQAEPLAEALGDTRRLGLLASYMASCVANLGDPDGCLASAQHALAMATALEDVGLQVVATSSLGGVYWLLSDYRRAAEAFRRTVEILHGAPLRERFGTAAIQSVYARAHLSRCLAELGAFAEGRGYGEDALRLAEAFAHPYSLAQGCAAVGLFYLRQGALPQAVHVFERGLAVSETAYLLPAIRMLNGRLGVAYALAGRVPEALPLLERALEQTLGMRQPINYAPFAIWLGEGYVLAGRRAEANQLGQRALEEARVLKQQGHEAYALRLLGEIAMHGDPPDVALAEAYYQQALILATALGMRPLVAHCHLGLGTLYAAAGQRNQARAALATAIGLYRAMEMTFWLPQAEATLAQVACITTQAALT